MDLASAVWVIDRTIGVEMGVGTQQGLPQGLSIIFNLKKKKKKIWSWISNSHDGKDCSLPNVTNSV